MTKLPRWRALTADGVAHAFPSRQAVALCGAKNADERYDWPRRHHCPDCLEAVANMLKEQN